MLIFQRGHRRIGTDSSNRFLQQGPQTYMLSRKSTKTLPGGMNLQSSYHSKKTNRLVEEHCYLDYVDRKKRATFCLFYRFLVGVLIDSYLQCENNGLRVDIAFRLHRIDS
jgi:hypothetical protein